MNSKLSAIHQASLEILKDVGLAVKSESIVDILKKRQFRVEGETVFFTEKQIREALKNAPAEFTIKARNPRYDIHLNQEATEYAPGYGCTRILERDGSERPALRQDFIKLLKLFEANKDFNINGGILIQPDDIPSKHCHLIMINCNYSGTGSREVQIFQSPRLGEQYILLQSG
jgi:trimethylamine--corrinoid protein Co-methyltransferase